MNTAQRKAAFERLLTDLARRRAERLGLVYAGTLRKLPPPPLPGERAGATRYYLNAMSADGGDRRLVELAGEAAAALRRAEAWVETGEGKPPIPGSKPRRAKIKT